MAGNYAQLVENYIKAAGSPADLYAGTLGATGASTSLDRKIGVRLQLKVKSGSSVNLLHS